MKTIIRDAVVQVQAVRQGQAGLEIGGEIVAKQYAQMACRYIMAGWLGWTMLDDIMRHGEPREGKHDGGATLFGVMIMILLLAGGGFWG